MLMSGGEMSGASVSGENVVQSSTHWIPRQSILFSSIDTRHRYPRLSTRPPHSYTQYLSYQCIADVMLPNYRVARVLTRSSAIAERPHDASCLSVVSFNSTVYLERSLLLLVTSATDLPLRTNKFCCCHKQDSPMPGAASSVRAINKCRRLSAVAYTSPSKCWRHATVPQ